MNPLRTTGGVLALLAAVCLILVQFLPWGGVSTSGGSFGGIIVSGGSMDSYAWNVKYSSSGAEDSTSWYDSELDEEDGIGQLRTSVPFLIAGLVLVATGAILVLAMRGSMGPVITLVGALVFAAGTILFAMGTDAFYSSDQDWAAAFYLAIVGGSLALVGGVLGLASGNRAG